MRRPRDLELRTAGILAATTAVIVWGSSAVLIKKVDGASGFAISFHRLWIGAIGLSIVHLLRGGRITWDLLRASAAGGVAFALDIVLFFIAVQETTITNATVVGALQPVLVLAIAARLFGERPRLLDGLLSLIAIVGCALVVQSADEGVQSTTGDLLAVGALFAWTWYFVASKRARRGLHAFEYLVGLSIVAVIVTAPFALVFYDELAVPTAEGWATIVAIAAVNGAIGHMLMNWAHAHVPLVVTSLLTLAVPVFSAIAAALFLDEAVRGLQVVGMAIVLSSLAAVVLNQTRREEVVVGPPVGVGDTPP